MSNRRFVRYTLLGSAVVGILAAAAASAQQAPADKAQEATELEEIVVTGSRIMRASALEGTIPVTSVAATELLEQGDINIGDALNDLPSLRSTYSQGNSTRFIGTAGLNFLDLRGLGITRTLVLVNGAAAHYRVARQLPRRHQPIEAGMEEVRRFDRMMSLYKDDSEITKVNLAAGKHPVRVSPEMIDAVEAAARVSDMTGGAFDITVGPLVVLWQLRLKEGTVPTDREIANVRKLVNYKNIAVDKKASTLYLKKPGMIMDLGVMKGYIADRVKDLMRKRGIENALIALAGDIWALGRRDAARGAILLTMATFYVCYGVFLAFPVAGPRYLFPPAANAATAVPVAAFTHRLLEGGSAWGTAFPSSHQAMASLLIQNALFR